MKNEFQGNPGSKIWLIGDSPPEKWKKDLRYPLDPRHPAVHNIWTPVLAQINDYLFDHKFRLKDESMYIQNAVTHSDYWKKECQDDRVRLTTSLRQEAQKNKPTIIISFGSRAYEVTRQALSKDESITGNLQAWSSEELGCAFRNAIKDFSTNKSNLFPLLHASVSRKFVESQAYYCEKKDKDEYIEDENCDYFSYVGKKIGEKLNHEHFYKTHDTLTPFPKR